MTYPYKTLKPGPRTAAAWHCRLLDCRPVRSRDLGLRALGFGFRVSRVFLWSSVEGFGALRV